MDTLGRVVRRLGIVAGLLLLSDVVMTPAMAALITYDFAGTVTQVDPRLVNPEGTFSQFNTSQHMSGFMTVDRTARDSSPTIGIYNVQNFQVTIGNYTATMTQPGLVNATDDNLQITNNGSLGPLAPSYVGDGIVLNIGQLNGNDVPFVLGTATPSRFEIDLFGPNGLLTSDALPNPVPSLASFTGVPEQWSLSFYDEAQNPAVSGALTSLTVVPLPAAGLLFGGGLVTLLGLGARGLREGMRS